MTENKPGNQQSEFDMLTEIRARLPDCMAPDGAEPCGAFRELHDRVVELEASHFRLADDALESANALSKLLLVGNRLARGQATPAEWHEAVKSVTPAPICVLSSEDSA